MAGLAGIIVREGFSEKGKYSIALEKMIAKLGVSNRQSNQLYTDDRLYAGNVIPISSATNDKFQFNHKIGILCIIEGLVFVNEIERKAVRERFSPEMPLSDLQYLPYLFDLYRKDLPGHITGWFNMVVYDKKTTEILILNDPLGYLPLYIFENDTVFLFASKIESLLNSGIVPNPQFDPTTIAEHLFFNYALTDHTYIKNISTLQNATLLHFVNQRMERTKYWEVSKWFDQKPVGERESVELINQGLTDSINKLLNEKDGLMNLSLTGGWDSRLVLSLLLPEHRERLKLYSFGAEGSQDITIPEFIAKKENLDYIPYLLDREYLDRDFFSAAIQTIALSNGTRNYKRTHYLHAIQKVSSLSDILISGIYGDEVFKIAQITGGTVLNSNTLDLIESDFDMMTAMNRFNNSGFWKNLNVEKQMVSEEFNSRLELLKKHLEGFESISQKYYYVRFELNLRKYFGAEVNSYNDYLDCFSPFIDFDFLNQFSQTLFMGSNYPFNSKDIRLKMKTTLLYVKLISNNHEPLIHYLTARGYSMKDATTLIGQAKILFKKYLDRRKKHPDNFLTAPTDKIVLDYLQKRVLKERPNLLAVSVDLSNNKTADINSLWLWMDLLQEKYF